MDKHEVLATFYQIARLRNVQITTTDGRLYVERWFNIKIQALYIKIQRQNSPEVIARIPYEQIQNIVQHSPSGGRREQPHALSPES